MLFDLFKESGVAYFRSVATNILINDVKRQHSSFLMTQDKTKWLMAEGKRVFDEECATFDGPRPPRLNGANDTICTGFKCKHIQCYLICLKNREWHISDR